MRNVDLYIVSSVVCTVEIIKLIASATIEAIHQKSFWKMMMLLNRYILRSPKETLVMLIPAALYAAQNNMVFIAISNLDTMTFQVTYQLKILTTALFSVTMLKKSLTLVQWVSLLILVAGVALVQMEGSSKKGNPVAGQNPSLGFFMICLCSLSSGFSGVYFEKIVKKAVVVDKSSPPISIWIRNIQLGIFGLFFSILALVFQDSQVIMEKGYFFGYDHVTWIIMGFQAFGGLLIGVVISYADNLLKGFATSLSIVLSSWMSYVLFGVMPTRELIIGCVLVIIATYLYSLPTATVEQKSYIPVETVEIDELKTIKETDEISIPK